MPSGQCPPGSYFLFRVPFLQYSFSDILQTLFRFYSGKTGFFTSFFTSMTLALTFAKRPRDHGFEGKKGRLDSCGQEESKHPTKKGISGNGPCRASPRDPPSPENRFPPKTVIRPPWRRIPMQTLCGPILSHDSPDSVISGPGPLMPERRISPPLEITIPCFPARSKRENASKRRKNRPPSHFLRDDQICWSCFASG